MDAEQEADAVDLLARRREWAAEADVLVYRCEVDSEGGLAFMNLDPRSTPSAGGTEHQRGRRTS
ncbi:MAG: hypothetical protein M3Z05_09505 [Gemmatimonadota bacterium]|nr:hypothetical protein [Gemmatimonadota bacterium]